MFRVRLAEILRAKGEEGGRGLSLAAGMCMREFLGRLNLEADWGVGGAGADFGSQEVHA